MHNLGLNGDHDSDHHRDFAEACAVGGVVEMDHGAECERFPSRIRASGFGVGHSLALVLVLVPPAFYSFYLAWAVTADARLSGTGWC